MPDTFDIPSLVPDLRGRLETDVPLAPLTWFRVGGTADYLFSPADEADLQYFLSNLPKDVPVMTLGLSSNTLIRDGGVAGIVIRLSAKGFGHVEREEGNRLSVGTAVPDKRLAAAALKEKLGGFAFYHGIPGSIGGALRMNAGANGRETKDVVISARGVDRAGKPVEFTYDDLGFEYRKSAIPADVIVTQAVFQGVPADPAVIEEEMAAVQHHRETVQPIKEKTGGSTFKNPPGHSAWKLVDEAGCRGFQVGGAQMSEMHCNFMINTGEATAYDLETLGETVRRRVYEHSGVLLQWEIKRVGRFAPGKKVMPYEGGQS